MTLSVQNNKLTTKSTSPRRIALRRHRTVKRKKIINQSTKTTYLRYHVHKCFIFNWIYIYTNIYIKPVISMGFTKRCSTKLEVVALRF